MVNQIQILSRIYYRTIYLGSIKDIEKIIERSESFEYQKYCKYRDFLGDLHNLSNYNYHIDRDLILYLKSEIIADRNKFHFYPFYGRNFEYVLEVTNHTLIYLTYNKNTIMKAEDVTHSEIFTSFEWYYENNSLFWEGSWFLNFTLLPFSYDFASTLPINNSILVKMNLHYDYDYGFGTGAEDLLIEQFLCFNSNFQIIFVCILFAALLMA
ncbi:MAG: hypothetical protein EU533_03560 [Promethearchaeota archaeon]|nr:MAG: hypothetical protein EU533_03560 [Candidatus Lokiarchaeota archaeon]